LIEKCLDDSPTPLILRRKAMSNIVNCEEQITMFFGFFPHFTEIPTFDRTNKRAEKTLNLNQPS